MGGRGYQEGGPREEKRSNIFHLSSESVFGCLHLYNTHTHTPHNDPLSRTLSDTSPAVSQHTI